MRIKFQRVFLGIHTCLVLKYHFHSPGRPSCVISQHHYGRQQPTATNSNASPLIFLPSTTSSSTYQEHTKIVLSTQHSRPQNVSCTIAIWAASYTYFPASFPHTQHRPQVSKMSLYWDPKWDAQLDIFSVPAEPIFGHIWPRETDLRRLTKRQQNLYLTYLGVVYQIGVLYPGNRTDTEMYSGGWEEMRQAWNSLYEPHYETPRCISSRYCKVKARMREMIKEHNRLEREWVC